MIEVTLALALIALLLGSYNLGRLRGLDHRVTDVETQMDLLSRSIAQSVKEQLDAFQLDLPGKVAVIVVNGLMDAIARQEEDAGLSQIRAAIAPRPKHGGNG